MNTVTRALTIKDIIPHLNKSILFQGDVTRSVNRYEARSKMFIEQGRTTLNRLNYYIGKNRFNSMFTWVECYATHH